MFIPTWILVTIGIVLLLKYTRVLGFFLTLLLILACLASLIAFIYFGAQHQYLIAFLSGTPFLIVGLWAILRNQSMMGGSMEQPSIEAVRWHLAMHRGSLGSKSSPVEAMKSAKSIAHHVHLGRSLYQLYDGIMNFPSWYESPSEYPEGETWRSTVIPRSAIARVPIAQIATLGLTPPESTRAEDCLIFKFHVKDKEYTLCGYTEAVPDWMDMVEDDPPRDAYHVHVIEEPNVEVLDVLLMYRGDAYADHFSGEHIEAFRPGSWLVTLYEVAAQVKAESEAQSKTYSERFEAERAKKFT